LAYASLFALAVILAGASVMSYRSEVTKIDPVAVTPLLDTIAKGESNGNYNAYYGHAGNTDIRFTEMSVAEVMRWQEEYVRQGSVSSAVGRYQIVRPTLAGLVVRLKLDPVARFDEALQDRLALALLERRGAIEYLDKKLSRQQFAANLAQEWAALPKATGDNPSESYYARDGINKSRIGLDEIYQALAAIES
jgi:conjugal transfer mating pair stabilization protein TraG